ncbi:MAG: hypothetical protein ABSE22_21385 [Xanthobacteraceae bacterium]|jgi:hypothetical protein
MTPLRGAIDLLLLSVATFAAAFATRWILLWDVMPVSWDYEPPQNGAFEAAYFLLTIQNVAAIIAAIALMGVSALVVQRLRQPVAQPIQVKRSTEL